jgi:hypothetical protein
MTTRTTVKTASKRMAMLFAVPLLIAGLSACATDDPGDAAATPAPSPSLAVESLEDYQLAFAECVRGLGVDLPDPGSGGIGFTADDAFTEAAQECTAKLGTPPAAPGGDRGSGQDTREEHLAIAACLREHGVDVPDPGPGEDLAIPGDVPTDAFEACAPNGVGGSTGR